MHKRSLFLLWIFILALVISACGNNTRDKLSSSPTAPSSKTPTITPDNEIIRRAKIWVDANVPYNQKSFRDSYRTDCSGFVSYSWQLTSSENTTTLYKFSHEIGIEALQPGDVLNNQKPLNDGHVVIFVKWINKIDHQFLAYEENGGHGGAIASELSMIKINNGWTIKEYDQYAKGPYIAQRLSNANSPLSSDYYGVWQGNGTQVNPNSQWTMLYSITGGQINSVIGTTAYPSINCGGDLHLVGITPESIQLSEHITYGSINQDGTCIDGGIVTLKATDNSMKMDWRSEEFPTTIGTGLLHRVSSPGNSLPKAFVGVWTGEGNQISPDEKWSILIGVAEGPLDTVIGTIAYPSLGCGGILTLLNASPNEIQLHEKITYGHCDDDGRVTLNFERGLLKYKWYFSNGTLNANGTVSRRSHIIN